MRLLRDSSESSQVIQNGRFRRGRSLELLPIPFRFPFIFLSIEFKQWLDNDDFHHPNLINGVFNHVSFFGGMGGKG